MAHVRTLLAVEARAGARSHPAPLGGRKYDEYAALIDEALQTLALDPQAGKPQPAIAPEAWTIHIAQRGRRAALVHVPGAGPRARRSLGARRPVVGGGALSALSGRYERVRSERAGVWYPTSRCHAASRWRKTRASPCAPTDRCDWASWPIRTRRRTRRRRSTSPRFGPTRSCTRVTSASSGCSIGSRVAPLFAVRGNIDEHAPGLPDVLSLDVVSGDALVLRILLLHIAVGGSRLRADARRLAQSHHAGLVVCGHSHVPLVARDGDIAVFNPGSAGPRRFQLPILFGAIDVGRATRCICPTTHARPGTRGRPDDRQRRLSRRVFSGITALLRNRCI